jgi:very-short-patch-repair endonuclease
MVEERKGCLAAILSLFGFSRSSRPLPPMVGKLPYLLRDDFLSPAEASFYRVLITAVGDQFLIFPKVGLQELFFVPRQRNRDWTYRNKIDRKHVDFVLCDPTSLKPRVAIELDDASHKRPNRMQRDEFVAEVFATTGLPLVRTAVHAAYSTQQIKAMVQPFLPAKEASKSTPLVAQEPMVTTDTAYGTAAQTPICAKCDIPLIIRTVRNGRHAGKQFYGCQNYPQCREMVSRAGQM